jgi:hypothetical protein
MVHASATQYFNCLFYFDTVPSGGPIEKFLKSRDNITKLHDTVYLANTTSDVEGCINDIFDVIPSGQSATVTLIPPAVTGAAGVINGTKEGIAILRLLYSGNLVVLTKP